MFPKLRLSVGIGSVILLFVLILIFGSIALAQNNNTGVTVSGEAQQETLVLTSPVPGGPGFVSLSAAAIIPRSSLYSYDFYGMALYYSGGQGIPSAEFMGAIPLPNGATITQFVVYYYDNSSINDIYAILMRTALDSMNGEVMASINSSGAVDGVRSGENTVIANPIIDQQSYSYLVDLILPADIDVRLAGIRVDYSYPVHLPLIKK